MLLFLNVVSLSLQKVVNILFCNGLVLEIKSWRIQWCRRGERFFPFFYSFHLIGPRNPSEEGTHRAGRRPPSPAPRSGFCLVIESWIKFSPPCTIDGKLKPERAPTVLMIVVPHLTRGIIITPLRQLPHVQEKVFTYCRQLLPRSRARMNDRSEKSGRAGNAKIRFQRMTQRR